MMKSSFKLYDSNRNFIKYVEIDSSFIQGQIYATKPSDWIPANKHPCVNQPDVSGMLLSFARKAEQRRLLARLCRFGVN
jgi:hypothetical protein